MLRVLENPDQQLGGGENPFLLPELELLRLALGVQDFVLEHFFEQTFGDDELLIRKGFWAGEDCLYETPKSKGDQHYREI